MASLTHPGTSTPTPTTFVQSPSIEDLLSARRNRSAQLATQSMYSTFTTRTEFDLPEAARLAMQEESANGLWSPSMKSTASEDDDKTEKEGLATPNMSESEYSRSPSVASVRMAAVVKGGGQARTFEYTPSAAVKESEEDEKKDGAEHQTSPSKRVLNARNLFINTALSAPVARPYPGQSTTPTFPLPHSAHIEIPSIPLTARSLPGTSTIVAATIPAAPLTALPPHITRPRRRSSLDSYASSMASPVEEDLTLGLNQASLQRMQSFLGPKMTHISPAPWSNENSNFEAGSDYTSESSFWNDDDPEIGSVQMATKTPRSRSVKEALGFSAPKAEVSVNLKGLGLAVAAETTSPTSRPSMASERSTKSRTTTASSDTSKHSGSNGSGGAAAGGKFKAFLSRSESRDIMSSPPPPVPTNAMMTVSNIVRSKSPDTTVSPLKQTSFLDLGAATLAPSSAVATSDVIALPVSTSTSSSRRRSLSNIETSISKQNLVALSSSTPAGSASTKPSSASTPPTPTEMPSHSVQIRKPLAPVRKRPPVYQQDSMASVTTVDSAMTSHSEAGKLTTTPSTSMSSLSSPLSDSAILAKKAGGNGIKLISLDAARERERERVVIAPAKPGPRTPVSPNPSSFPSLPALPPPLPANPPTAPPKGLKSKKSGFLKYFKHKEEFNAPTVPRISTDDSTPLALLLSARSVSNPTDFRRGDISPVLTAPSPSIASGRTSPLPAAALPPPKSRTNSSDGKSAASAQPSIASIEMSEASRKANTSAPPAVSLVKPSPDLADTQAPFPAVQHTSKAKRIFADSQPGGLAPSLSLRPVSMMFSSMPQAFLADLQAAETRKHGIAFSSSRSDGATSPSFAHTPDTPSFVFLDTDNVVTPPAVSDSDANASRTPFGLPTPPHSASSSSRTFSALFDLPPPPIMLHESNHEAMSSAAYRARILLLEKQIRLLHMQLDSGGDGKENDKLALETADFDGSSSKNTGKACEKCGCSCRTASGSVLSRPRVVGYGNMFSSGRG